MMAKSSTKNQRRRRKYDDLAKQNRASQPKPSSDQSTTSNNGVEATLIAVRAVAQRRPHRQAQATRSKVSVAEPAPAKSLIKNLPNGIAAPAAPQSAQPTASIPTPMVLVKSRQLEAIQADNRPRCAIPRCKERDDICPFEDVADCIAQRTYKEALEYFIS